MSKRIVVGHQHKATGPLWPLYAFSIGWLYLDRFGAPGWAHGVFWTLAVLVFAGSIVDYLFEQEEREPVWQPPKKGETP